MPPACRTGHCCEKIQPARRELQETLPPGLVGGRLRWHFSPQYFTSSQFSRHFLRYSKGRPQVMQILVGNWPLRSLAGSMVAA